MGSHDGEVAVSIERLLAGDNFVERNAQRVQVGTFVSGLALYLLGRHVVHGSQGRTGGGKFIGFFFSVRYAKVHQLHRALGRQHHVGGLNVAVDDMLKVRITERVQHLVKVVQRLRNRDAPTVQPA